MTNVIALAAVPELSGFDAFWTLYPRHVAKRDAYKAWLQHVTADLQIEVITATARWRKVWLRRGELEYVPYPASWIRGWREMTAAEIAKCTALTVVQVDRRMIELERAQEVRLTGAERGGMREWCKT